MFIFAPMRYNPAAQAAHIEERQEEQRYYYIQIEIGREQGMPASEIRRLQEKLRMSRAITTAMLISHLDMGDEIEQSLYQRKCMVRNATDILSNRYVKGREFCKLEMFNAMRYVERRHAGVPVVYKNRRI